MDSLADVLRRIAENPEAHPRFRQALREGAQALPADDQLNESHLPILRAISEVAVETMDEGSKP